MRALKDPDAFPASDLGLPLVPENIRCVRNLERDVLGVDSLQLDLVGGRFALRGEMTFDTAEQILRASEEPFEEHTQLEIDLSEVTDSD